MNTDTPIRRMVELTGVSRTDATDVRVFRFSTHAFTTTGSDTPADTRYDTDLKQASDVTRRIWEPGTTQGQSARSYSSVILAKTKDTEEMVSRYAFDGRPAVIRSGPISARLLSEHASLALVIDRQPTGNTTQIEFVLRENVQLLTKPLQQNKYGGTNVLPNGVDGTASDIGGKERPWVFGTVFEWPLVCVNTAKLIYQAHDGRIEYWPVTYDKGVPLLWNGEYVSQAEIENDALQPAPGYFKTWANGGMCRLGSSPIGVVTADFTVGALPADRTAAQGMKAVWLKAGYTLADIEAADLAQLDLDNAAEIGFGINDATTGEKVCNDITDTVGAFWGASLAAKLRVKRLGKTIGNIVASFDENDMPEGQGPSVQSSSDPERGAPLKELTLQFGKRYVTQTDPAAGVTDARRAYLKESYSQVTRSNKAVVAQTYLNAAAPTRPTLFVYEADALAETLRQLELREVDRPRVLFTAFDSLAYANVDLGDEIEVSHPSYDLEMYGAKRRFFVLSVTPNSSENKRAFTGWGDPLLDRNLLTSQGVLLRASNGNYLIARAA